MTMQEIADDCGLPINTLIDQIEDLRELGAVTRKQAPEGIKVMGRRPYYYYLSTRMKGVWNEAGLERRGKEIVAIQRNRIKLKIKRVHTGFR